MQQGVCTFKQLSPKEAEEERLILESIAWPEIPPWPTPISIKTTCDPAHSSFTILPRRGGGQWQIGDQLRVMIKMSDFKGRPKTSGGDFLLARLKNSKLQAGVVGKVVDHLNGSYSAVFSLVWEGDAVVEVMLDTIILNVIVPYILIYLGTELFVKSRFLWLLLLGMTMVADQISE